LSSDQISIGVAPVLLYVLNSEPSAVLYSQMCPEQRTSKWEPSALNAMTPLLLVAVMLAMRTPVLAFHSNALFVVPAATNAALRDEISAFGVVVVDRVDT
jgi:hypothetical protein